MFAVVRSFDHKSACVGAMFHKFRNNNLFNSPKYDFRGNRPASQIIVQFAQEQTLH